MRTLRLNQAASKKALIGAVLAIAGGAVVFIYGLQPDKPVTEAIPAEVITYSTDTPDETEPDASFVWKGAANDPKKIIIPSLGIDNYIQNVGVDQNHEIAVPNNTHLAGWFVDSVRPGDKGLSIIDGHLNGRQRDGVFANLENIQEGAEISVAFGDNSTRQFRVAKVVTVDTDKAAEVLFSQDPGATHQLNLVTCGGNFDREARLYDKRIIVISQLMTDG